MILIVNFVQDGDYNVHQSKHGHYRQQTSLLMGMYRSKSSPQRQFMVHPYAIRHIRHTTMVSDNECIPRQKISKIAYQCPFDAQMMQLTPFQNSPDKFVTMAARSRNLAQSKSSPHGLFCLFLNTNQAPMPNINGKMSQLSSSLLRWLLLFIIVSFVCMWSLLFEYYLTNNPRQSLNRKQQIFSYGTSKMQSWEVTQPFVRRFWVSLMESDWEAHFFSTYSIQWSLETIRKSTDQTLAKGMPLIFVQRVMCDYPLSKVIFVRKTQPECTLNLEKLISFSQTLALPITSRARRTIMDDVFDLPILIIHSTRDSPTIHFKRYQHQFNCRFPSAWPSSTIRCSDQPITANTYPLMIERPSSSLNIIQSHPQMLYVFSKRRVRFCRTRALQEIVSCVVFICQLGQQGNYMSWRRMACVLSRNCGAFLNIGFRMLRKPQLNSAFPKFIWIFINLIGVRTSSQTIQSPITFQKEILYLLRAKMSHKLYLSQFSLKDMQQCRTCGKLDKEMFRCSRCTLATYCSQQCQKKDWPIHKKCFCREQGKKLPVFKATVNTGPDLVPLKARMNQTHFFYELKAKEQGGQVGLFCYICGDEQDLVKLISIVACEDCANIQVNM